MMHEAARHAIHSYETLSVTAETIEAMQQHLTYISSQVVSSGKSDPKYSQQLQTRMDVQIRMLRNFVRRSQSNRERLQNEIALVNKASIQDTYKTNRKPGLQYERTTRQWRHANYRSGDHGLSAPNISLGTTV